MPVYADESIDKRHQSCKYTVNKQRINKNVRNRAGIFVAILFISDIFLLTDG